MLQHPRVSRLWGMAEIGGLPDWVWLHPRGLSACLRHDRAGRAVALRAADPALAHFVLASGKTLGSVSALRLPSLAGVPIGLLHSSICFLAASVAMERMICFRPSPMTGPAFANNFLIRTIATSV